MPFAFCLFLSLQDIENLYNMLVSKKDKLAITFKDDKYTYEQLLRYSQIYADVFSSQSVPEKVLICAQNSPEWCFAFLGTMRCKAIAVPLDAQSTKKEIEYAIITAGGINIKEINSATMESKLIKGLHFAGEIINRDDLQTNIGGLFGLLKDGNKVPSTEASASSTTTYQVVNNNIDIHNVLSIVLLRGQKGGLQYNFRCNRKYSVN